MTLADILALRAAKPREFDALVSKTLFPGKHVHDIRRSDWGCEPSDPERYCVRCNGGWYWKSKSDANELCMKAVPPYTGSADADLAVHRVACLANKQVSRNDYFGVLGLILANRRYERPPGYGHAGWARGSDWMLDMVGSYQPGDFAASALAVVMEGKS